MLSRTRQARATLVPGMAVQLEWTRLSIADYHLYFFWIFHNSENIYVSAGEAQYPVRDMDIIRACLYRSDYYDFFDYKLRIKFKSFQARQDFCNTFDLKPAKLKAEPRGRYTSEMDY